MKHDSHPRSAVRPHAFELAPAARRGGTGANLLVGLLVVGAVGAGAWKVLSREDAIAEADPDAIAAEIAESAIDANTQVDPTDGLGADSAPGDVPSLVEILREAQEDAASSGGQGIDPARTIQELSRDREAFSKLIESGQIQLSPEASATFSSGGILPAHWVRVVGGRIVIADPGSATPPYQPLELPFTPALAYPGGEPVYPVRAADDEARFGADGLPNTGIWRGKPAFGDLDGDGDLDLVASLRMWTGGDKGEGLHVWLNEDGGSRWVPSVEGLRRDLGYGGSDLADIDGDGALDVGFACHNGYPRAYLARVEEGQRTWVEVSEGLSSMGVCADVCLADLTGNGVPELACLGLFSGTGGLYVYSFDRERQVWFMLAELLEPNDYGYQVDAHDMDGDGTLELVATTNQGVRVVGFEDGAFVDRSAGLPVPVLGGTLMQALPFDLEDDGIQELLVLGWHNDQGYPIREYRFEADEAGGGTWTQMDVDVPETESIDDGMFVELDGDPGRELLLLAREGMVLAEMTADGSIVPIVRISDKASRYHVQVADLDGDGLHEAVVVERGGVHLIDLAATYASATR